MNRDPMYPQSPREIDRLAIEQLCQRHNAGELLRELSEDEVNQGVCERISAVMALIADSKKPRLAADLIAWISGMHTHQGISMPELAKKHGISKQAFNQAATRLQKELGLGKTRAMRTDEARAAMSKACRSRGQSSAAIRSPAAIESEAGALARTGR